MTTTFHRHWRDVPEGASRWPNLSPAEIACRDTAKLLVNEPALDKLQALRERLGKPLIVRSAYGSPGARPRRRRREAVEAPRRRRLRYRHDEPTIPWRSRRWHAKVGSAVSASTRARASCTSTSDPARQWGERFPVRSTALAAETPPVREVLADSRTMKNGGAAGVATLGAAGVEVAQSILDETQSAILPDPRSLAHPLCW